MDACAAHLLRRHLPLCLGCYQSAQRMAWGVTPKRVKNALESVLALDWAAAEFVGACKIIWADAIAPLLRLSTRSGQTTTRRQLCTIHTRSVLPTGKVRLKRDCRVCFHFAGGDEIDIDVSGQDLVEQAFA